MSHLVQRFARLAVVLAAIFGSTFATLAVTSAPASASVDYGYDIDVKKACFYRYGGQESLIDASFTDVGNASTWYCKRKVSDSNGFGASYTNDGTLTASAQIGGEWTIIGDVDMQLFCDRNHPGTVARVADNYAPWWDVYNWRCQ